MGAAPYPRKRKIPLISGNADILIRKATEDDLNSVKTLADAHRRELGFIRRPTLVEATRREEIIVALHSERLVGFVHYHHRRDEQTTLYDIVVTPDYRRTGLGRDLVHALMLESRAQKKQFIVLKCPEELAANAFYERIGFERWQEDPGKRRRLIVWRLALQNCPTTTDANHK